MSDDDEKTEFWSIDDDPDEDGFPETVLERPLFADEDLTQVRRSVSAGAPAVERGHEPARNWLDVAPEPARDRRDADPEPAPSRRAPRARPRAAKAGRRRRRPVWPRILAPFAFLAAVVTLFSLVVSSGVLDESGAAKGRAGKPAAASSTRPAVKTYTVKEGDTLSEIALKFDTTTAELLRLNPTVSSSTVNPGDKLRIPQD
jgi:nucleoid-associated protein YgaU